MIIVMSKSRMKRRLIILCLSTVALFFYCEYLVYFVTILQCSWPSLKWDTIGSKEEAALNAMFVADTHLLGPVRGHWFDKLRREWQMYRSFQTAIQLHQPEAVFFLGDIFDEGDIVSLHHFDLYVERFNSLFYVPETTKKYVIVGNHDMGFHYRITPSLKKRFETAFNSSGIRRIRLKGVNFILINSMALEGDGCFLCKPAMNKIIKISEDFRCENDKDNKTGCVSNIKSYSRPVLLQHFPLYRVSDESCTGEDAAPDNEKEVRFRERIDCISSESSQLLLGKLEPRLVLSGHTHHGCLYHHPVTYDSDASISQVPEYSVPSFSWRNRDNPSFVLGRFTANEYGTTKCSLPRETTVMLIYYFGTLAILLATCGYYPRRSRDIGSNLKIAGIIIISCWGYWYIKKR